MSLLSIVDHSRDAADMTYVYPVVSRRAGGVSLGINLSPNDACNFRCIYCQVPGLARGASPSIDLMRFERELNTLLEDILHGDFLERRVPEGARALRDVAFSGNGEPTSSPDFAAAVEVVGRALGQRELLGEVPIVLITNGTLLGKPKVIAAIEHLARLDGKLWFKLDGVTRESFGRVNDTPLDVQAHLSRLGETSKRIPTWVQTCLFALDGAAPDENERSRYLSALGDLLSRGAPLCGVHLYSIARESMQPEAPRLRRLSPSEMADWAQGIAELGLEVTVNA